jgi:hypothetical protein
MLELEILAGWHIHGGKPAVPNPKFTFGFAQTVGHHGQESAFIGGTKSFLLADRSEQFSDAQSLPEGFGQERNPIGVSVMELEVKGEPNRGGQRQLSFIQRIDDLDLTNAGDGTAKADKLVAFEIICPAEAVEDLGDGFSGDGIPLVMGELVVGDDGSVLIVSFGSAQVHNCLQ